MRRREFIASLGSAAAWPVVARAQQVDRVRRVGMLSSLTDTDPQVQGDLVAFAKVLQDLGWAPGRNVMIEHRFALGDSDRMRRYAKELVEWRPDVIVGHTTPAVAALRDETRTIPIVFVIVSDPIGKRLRLKSPESGRSHHGIR
jgi:putative tryptophan/tyrosine transport system substrate-binding protein